MSNKRVNFYIMRHGEAVTFAESDAKRALTPRGIKQSQQVAEKSQELGASHFSKVLVSPYLRAQQTWQHIASYYHTDAIEECQDITPYGQAESVAHYICALAQAQSLDSVLVVSHLPLVGYLTAELSQATVAPMFSTSSMACVEVDLETLSGELKWQITV